MIYECYYRLVKSISMSLESSEYLTMFKQFELSINRVNNDQKKYCSIMMAQMWIETTPNELYEIWRKIMHITLNCEPRDVVQNKENTKSLIEQIMYKFATIIPETKCDQTRTPLQLTKYPIATLSDLFSFINKMLLSFKTKTEEDNVFLNIISILSNQNYINTMIKW